MPGSSLPERPAAREPPVRRLLSRRDGGAARPSPGAPRHARGKPPTPPSAQGSGTVGFPAAASQVKAQGHTNPAWRGERGAFLPAASSCAALTPSTRVTGRACSAGCGRRLAWQSSRGSDPHRSHIPPSSCPPKWYLPSPAAADQRA